MKVSHVHSFFFKRGPEAVTPYACFAPKKNIKGTGQVVSGCFCYRFVRSMFPTLLLNKP
ncbi:unnamed protein product [Prunus brigantina]